MTPYPEQLLGYSEPTWRLKTGPLYAIIKKDTYKCDQIV